MCLAVPSRIVDIDNLLATVDIFGARKEVSLILLPDEAHIGDYVLIHAGFALQKIDEAAALDAMNLIKEYAEALEREENAEMFSQQDN
jgi:hydrogenase expression/formation protein HypC